VQDGRRKGRLDKKVSETFVCTPNMQSNYTFFVVAMNEEQTEQMFKYGTLFFFENRKESDRMI
jgi:hypothetical protein